MQEQVVQLSAVEEQLYDFRKRLMTLEWDKTHNQLNSSMEAKYAEIRAECEKLQKVVDDAKAEARQQELAAEEKAKEAKQPEQTAVN